jgi:hypothetical protein
MQDGATGSTAQLARALVPVDLHSARERGISTHLIASAMPL